MYAFHIFYSYSSFNHSYLRNYKLSKYNIHELEKYHLSISQEKCFSLIFIINIKVNDEYKCNLYLRYLLSIGGFNMSCLCYFREISFLISENKNILDQIQILTAVKDIRIQKAFRALESICTKGEFCSFWVLVNQLMNYSSSRNY